MKSYEQGIHNWKGMVRDWLVWRKKKMWYLYMIFKKEALKWYHWNSSWKLIYNKIEKIENIKLLKKHKKRTIIGHAFVKLIFIYICILTFLFSSVYFRSHNENILLETKVSSTISVLKKINTKTEKQFDAADMKLLENVYLKEIWSQVIHKVDYNLDNIDIKSDKITKIDNYKYLYKENALENKHYIIIARIFSNNFSKEILLTLTVLLLLGPFIYSLLYYISDKGLSKIYKPIEEMITSLETFAVNINHEFKTSISEIISSLELADITKEYQEANQQAMWSVSRLNNILDSLSLMIHFVNSDYRKQKTNIISELDDSIHDFKSYINTNNINIKKMYNTDEKIILFIDKAPVILCFTNILKNAIKYSEEWWNIEIYIEENHFTIKDYWSWIEKDNINKIFDRYFRESNSTKWSGIGLSIVKRITEIYWWKIQIESEKHAFTKVSIYF